MGILKSKEQVKVYEFFLPLAQEKILRQFLDDLFYKDSILARLKEIGEDELRKIFPIKENEAEPDYLERVYGHSENLFMGYSIKHVTGRYRTGKLLTKIEAAQGGHRPFLDETTAVVRFIFPYSEEGDVSFEKLDQLFHLIFVKAIIESTPEEEEIWLLESQGESVLHKFIREET